MFQYHGAEHKTIHAYEHGDPLTIDEIQKYSPRHPRCGTSFLIIVGLVAFFIFLGLAPFDLDWRWQILSRLILIPVVAGASYELLKAAANQAWMAWASRPGIWLQGITTNLDFHVSWWDNGLPHCKCFGSDERAAFLFAQALHIANDIRDC